MNNYSFITDNIIWSFSSASTYETCPYAWKLTYIDAEERTKNIFSEIGLSVHSVLENYFNKELDLWNLPLEFEKVWNKTVVSEPPYFMVKYGTVEKDYKSLMTFFEDLSWDIDDFEVLGNELHIKSEYRGLELTIRPDLIFKDKKTGTTYLSDFKTSKPLTPKGKPKKGKLEPYWTQMGFYSYIIEKETDIKIDKLRVYLPKYGSDTFFDFDYTEEFGKASAEWFYKLATAAMNDGEYPPNNTKKNAFFCQSLCSVSHACEYKDVIDE